MIRARLILAFLVVAFAISACAALYFGLLSGELPKNLNNFLKSVSVDFQATLETKNDKKANNYSSFSSTSTSSSEIKININNNFVYPSPTPVVSRAPTMVKSCYLATVYHLDGSTSNRCYTQTDAGQIDALAGQYRSVQSNIDWQTRIYEQDKWAFETYGGDLYKTSMERHAKDLQAAKDKLGPIVLSMQEIEKRGW